MPRKIIDTPMNMERLLILIIIFSILSCEYNHDKLYSNNILQDKTEINDQPISASDTIMPQFIESTIKRIFDNDTIPIKVYSSFNEKGFGEIDSIKFVFENKAHLLQPEDYILSSANSLQELHKIDDYHIRFEDYNFDGYPDLVIYNSSSGVKNVYEDKYLYNKTEKRFIYNQLLSSESNLSIDTVHQTLSSLEQGGMASMI